MTKQMRLITGDVSISITLYDTLRDFVCPEGVVDCFGDVAIGVVRGLTNCLSVAGEVGPAAEELGAGFEGKIAVESRIDFVDQFDAITGRIVLVAGTGSTA